jgi:hypothetical protein
MIEGSPVNAIDYVPLAERAAILAGTSTYDCTSALQSAINFCIANNTGLQINGRFTITSSLVIDRPTDGPTFQKYFEITSTTGGSFYVGNQSINMFTTTLGSVAASQFIWFDGITFEQEFTSNATYVLDGGKFLRMQFHGCLFLKVPVLTATTYTQSYRFDNCNIRFLTYDFFKTTIAALDVHFHSCIFEADSANGIYMKSPQGCSIVNTLMEGFGANAIVAFNTVSLHVAGCYFEANVGNDLRFASSDPNYGISLVGNSFNNLTGNSVQWSGNEYGGVSIGNTGYSDYAVHNLNGQLNPDIFILDRNNKAGPVTDNSAFGNQTAIFGQVINAVSGIRYQINTLAATATPTVANFMLCNTSGTTAITNFSNGVTGQIITILAQGNITITNGANIQLSGAANFAMTALDTLTLVQVSTDLWRELSRSVN